jgi:hypothetical protein
VRRKRLWITVASAMATIAVTATIASAVWSTSGAGSGAGGATVAQGLVVTAVTPSGPAASLYPGGPAGQVYLTIKNPNPYAVTVTSLAWGTPVSTSTTTCPSSNISVDANAPTSASIPIAANTTSGALQINNVLDLAHSAPDGCQGVTFDVPVTVTGVQQ